MRPAPGKLCSSFDRRASMWWVGASERVCGVCLGSGRGAEGKRQGHRRNLPAIRSTAAAFPSKSGTGGKREIKSVGVASFYLLVTITEEFGFRRDLETWRLAASHTSGRAEASRAGRWKKRLTPGFPPVSFRLTAARRRPPGACDRSRGSRPDLPLKMQAS